MRSPAAVGAALVAVISNAWMVAGFAKPSHDAAAAIGTSDLAMRTDSGKSAGTSSLGGGPLLTEGGTNAFQGDTHFAAGKTSDTVLRSFLVVSVAELFDKTWFVALICAMNYGRRLAFAGAFTALFIHVLLAAALGVAISRFFSISFLCFSTAAVFLLLSMVYFWEFLQAKASDDAIEERTGEAKEALEGEEKGKALPWKECLFRVFVAVFVAEWGDRTQVAMVTLHSSAPWLPVCLGSTVAFFVLTLSAVAAATLLEGTKLSEKLVLGLSAVSFLVFAVLTVRDGLHERNYVKTHGALLQVLESL